MDKWQIEDEFSESSLNYTHLERRVRPHGQRILWCVHCMGARLLKRHIPLGIF